MKRVRKIVVWVFSTLLVLGIASMFHPLGLPGPYTMIVIHGNSMLPTYHTNDMVVLQSQRQYHNGEIAAYHVPKGQLGAGDTVIHRIVGGDGTSGFNLKGDNNPSVDPWHPPQADMVGSPVFYSPQLGQVFVLLHQPVLEAGLAAAVMVTYMIWRRPKSGEAPKAKRGKKGRTLEPALRPTGPSSVALLGAATGRIATLLPVASGSVPGWTLAASPVSPDDPIATEELSSVALAGSAVGRIATLLPVAVGSVPGWTIVETPPHDAGVTQLPGAENDREG
jgi:signal peptidase